VYAALTVRKLKPGTYEDWRRAWEPDQWPEGFSTAYILRNVDDPDEVIAFGFTDASREQLQRDPSMQREEQRSERMKPFIESIGADGFYEVVDVVEPARSTSGAMT
jgi:hypothetical protein